jgi:hypothetical protein
MPKLNFFSSHKPQQGIHGPYLTKLPHELILNVAEYLPEAGRLALALTSRQLHSACRPAIEETLLVDTKGLYNFGGMYLKELPVDIEGDCYVSRLRIERQLSTSDVSRLLELLPRLPRLRTIHISEENLPNLGCLKEFAEACSSLRLEIYFQAARPSLGINNVGRLVRHYLRSFYSGTSCDVIIVVFQQIEKTALDYQMES